MAATSLRGAMIWSAWISPNSRPRLASNTSAVESSPARALASMTSSSSSGASVDCRSRTGRTPTSRATPTPIPFRSQMKGRRMRVKTSMGAATRSAVRSARARAMCFGASSPNTISTAVMKMNATVTAIVCAAAVPSASPSRSSSPGSIRLASAGSPTQPSPRLDMVTPSCVVAMHMSSRFSEPSSTRARA